MPSDRIQPPLLHDRYREGTTGRVLTGGNLVIRHQEHDYAIRRPDEWYNRA